MTRSASTYRPDIDGLRAVAVLAVVADHLGTRLTGGYVGVDVFFVISGYLISAHILSEMRAGSFTLANFYERRVRRIFPALLVVLLAVSAAAYHYLLPVELVGYARSLAAALLSVSNIQFWRETGYFAYGSELKPLLHTWSLAVEEQFYLFFPLFLMAVRRWFPQRVKAAIWTVLAVSLTAAVLYLHHDSSAVFFLSPLRAWELMCGTVLSQRYVPVPRTALQRNAAAATGLLLVLAPALLYTERTPFPGLAAVPPCLGAALIIAAGETGSSLVGRMLSWRPVVFVGLISYSLYLWHWPVIVYLRQYAFLEQSALGRGRAKLVYVAVSLALAALSWALVETPFRKPGRLRPGRRMLFALTGAASVAVLAVAAVFLGGYGLPWRFSTPTLEAAQYLRAKPGVEWRKGVCFLDDDSTFADFDPQRCMPQGDGRPAYLLVGDSHGAQMYPGLKEALPEVDLGQATVGACAPLAGEFRFASERYESNCRKMADFVYRQYLPTHRVHTVILSGVWLPGDLPNLRFTAEYLRRLGVRMVVIGPTPWYMTDLPRLLAAETARHQPGMAAHNAAPEPAAYDRQLGPVVRSWEMQGWRVPYISYFEDMCPDRTADPLAQARSCPVYAAPGVPMLFDAHHLTVEGSERFVEEAKRRGQLP